MLSTSAATKLLILGTRRGTERVRQKQCAPSLPRLHSTKTCHCEGLQ
jgi:hypothetical protein